MPCRRDTEDLIKLFKSSLFGFRHNEEYYDKGEHIQTRIQAECASRCNLGQ